jgi:UDP-N-acetylmuramyl pentapeptide phosphotransferase/UDP-N-acetylglucosamine-1-phosphate transferase
MFAFGSIWSFILAAVVLIACRKFLRRFPRERRLNYGEGSFVKTRRYLIPGGLSIFLAFVWVLVLPKFLPQTEFAGYMLFGVMLLLMAFGVVAIGFRIYLWFIE